MSYNQWLIFANGKKKTGQLKLRLLVTMTLHVIGLGQEIFSTRKKKNEFIREYASCDEGFRSASGEIKCMTTLNLYKIAILGILIEIGT